MLALGLIETYGLVGAIEAADAMLKTADVYLLERNSADAGLITITVAGEVSAVQAAVQAGRERVQQVEGNGRLVSAHVIPRPDLELASVLKLGTEDGGPNAPAPAPAPAPKAPAAPAAPAAAAEKAPAAQAPAPSQKESPAATEGDKAAPVSARLNTMSLARLRQLARTVEGIGLDEKAIAAADRKTLIAAIEGAVR